MKTARIVILAAWVLGAAPGVQAQEAADVFQAGCNRCHTLERVAEKLGKRVPDTRAPFLATMLGNHFPAPEASRPALAALLLAAIPPAPATP